MKWAQKAENQKPRCLRRGEKGQRKGVGGQGCTPPPQTPPSIWRNCINRNIITELWNPANIAQQKCFNEKGSYSKSCFENISISVICICLVSLSPPSISESYVSLRAFSKKVATTTTEKRAK